MKPFEYTRPATQQGVLDAVSKPGAKIIAGGTNLVDLMKRGVTAPDKLIDINGLPLQKIEKIKTGISIGALAINSVVAENKIVLAEQPLLAMALVAGASPQLRNMATTGGNIMQRTRCTYFYDIVMPCNKRSPGSGCGALEGYNRMHAIFGAGPSCIAVHPSDMCVALAALDAVVVVGGRKAERRIPFTDFHRLPGDKPELDNLLAADEMIIGVEIPDNSFSKNSHYLKIRDRQSYAFAVVSVAAALDIQNGVIRKARLAMGGVAHKPWRLTASEDFLVGKNPSPENFSQAGALAVQGAKAYEYNAFKIKLTPAAVAEALRLASLTS